MSENAPRRQAPSGPNRMMLRRTLFLMAACGIVAFLVLAAKLYEIQILKHEEYESAAISQQIRETTVSAARGTIYDTNGAILAMSASVDTIYLSPAEISANGEDAEMIASGLSEILGVDYDTVFKKAMNLSSWYEVVARKVEQDVAERVRQFKSENNLVGVKIETDTKRYYPYGSLACHIVGFVGMDNTGLSGLESKYESTLAGESGSAVRSTTAAGTELLYTNFEDYYDAEDGDSITLTIDTTIQYYLEKHLSQAVEDYGIRNGACAICMEVDTGAILGMVSLGNFDLNDYQAISSDAQEYINETAASDEERAQLLTQAQYLQWRNKAISDTYEPGSTFKIITLAMALDLGVVDESSTFYCGGSVQVTGDTKPRNCWRTTGHGQQTLTEAVQHSCNVAFINIGVRVGAENFYRYAEAFGFLELSSNDDAMLSAKTGIDIGGESGSIWWSKNTFCNPDSLSQLAAASFGQTFNITPIQLITAVSACVNGGNLMQPYLVKSVTDADGNPVSENEPVLVRRVISEETSATVCRILEQVVGDQTQGTGRNAYVAGYRIGGKTGTSTKTTNEVATGEKEYMVSFIGFAPADDPKVAVLVVLDNPSSDTGIYVSGGQMAAPVVGKMFADILPYIGVEAEYTGSEEEHMDRSVPNVVGLTVTAAQSALSDAGISARVIGSGDTVTAQLPAAGSVIASGSEIIIYAGAQPSADLEEMPDLTKLTYADARDRLSYYGIYLSSSGLVSNPSGQLVSTQSIPAGSMVEHGTVVEVTLVTDDSDILGLY